jgi:Ca2+-binding RTX toxin-like protein
MAYYGTTIRNPLPSETTRITSNEIAEGTEMNLIVGTDAGEQLNGTDLDDEIFGLGGDDLILGGQGNDIIHGGDGNDFLVDIFGLNEIYGDGGNDYIYNAQSAFGSLTVPVSTAHGGTGNDTIVGGYAFGDEGDDILQSSEGFDFLDGGDGNDTLILFPTQDQSLDRVQGGAGTDTLLLGYGVYGLAGQYELEALQYAASIERVISETPYALVRARPEFLASVNYMSAPGLAIIGSGTVAFGAASELVSTGVVFEIRIQAAAVTLDLTGQSGTSIFYITASDLGSSITGSEAGDMIFGGISDDRLSGGGGDDIIRGSGGNDIVDGGAGSDTYSVQGYDSDYAIARSETGGFVLTQIATYLDPQGIDLLKDIEFISFNGTLFDLANSTIGFIRSGTAGADTVMGSIYDDKLSGLAGNDVLQGGAGNDLLIGGKGNDLLDGGAGVDTASYAGATLAVQVDLAIAGPQNTGSEGKDQLVSIENLIGSSFNDALFGNGEANRLVGGDGNDTLNGRGGDDTLVGGFGNDMLVGGAGADTFVFDAALGKGNYDTVQDFVSGTDKIALSPQIFGAFYTPGAIAADAFYLGDHAITADQHLIYDAHKGALYYDPDGNGGLDQFMIAQFHGNPVLAASDFLIIG